jgi:hypothetical protein
LLRVSMSRIIAAFASRWNLARMLAGTPVRGDEDRLFL